MQTVAESPIVDVVTVVDMPVAEVAPAVRTLSVEEQRELLDALLFEVEVARCMLQQEEGSKRESIYVPLCGCKPMPRASIDRLFEKTARAGSLITDPEIRSALKSDVIDVVAAMRKSPTYQSSPR